MEPKMIQAIIDIMQAIAILALAAIIFRHIKKS